MVISLTGLPGSGKSTVGRELASQLGWDFVDLDEAIVTSTGRSIPDLFTEGEENFRAAEERALLEILACAEHTSTDGKAGQAEMPGLVLALGGGTICYEAKESGVFTHDERPRPGQAARDAVLKRTTCFWLRVEPETAAARIPDPSSRPLLAGEAGKAVDRQSSLEAMRQLLTSRERFYRQAHFHIPCDYLDPDEAAASIITLLDL